MAPKLPCFKGFPIAICFQLPQGLRLHRQRPASVRARFAGGLLESSKVDGACHRLKMSGELTFFEDEIFDSILKYHRKWCPLSRKLVNCLSWNTICKFIPFLGKRLSYANPKSRMLRNNPPTMAWSFLRNQIAAIDLRQFCKHYLQAQNHWATDSSGFSRVQQMYKIKYFDLENRMMRNGHLQPAAQKLFMANGTVH